MSGGPIRLDLVGLGAEVDLRVAVDHLEAGGVLVHPTETVYGFGSACTLEGVEAMARLKRRERHKPFLVLAPSVQALAGLSWTDEARTLAGIFWPGAVTLVLSDPSGSFPPGVRSEAGTVAVRVSPNAVVQALMEAGAGAMTSSSANAPGQPPARTASEAIEAIVALGGGEEVMVLDAGALPPSGPSTLVDCTGSEVRVLREGTVPIERLRCALPHIHEGTP